MSLRSQFNDNHYKNWLRACLGLKYVKDVVASFVDDEVKTFHASIIANICGAGTCNSCATDLITRRRWRCPNNVCHLFMYEIEQNHRFGRPCWKNSDTTKWCTDHWEIAKCFMSPGYETKCSAADTDCTGLLAVCINGLFLPPTLTGQISVPGNAAGTPVDIFHKVRDIRNSLLHTASMGVSDADRQSYIQDMITLLSSYKQQPVDRNTQDAIDKLEELNTTDIFINATDELGILNTKLEACNRVLEDAENEIDTLKAQVTASDTRQMDTKRELDEHRQEQATENSRLEGNIADTASSLRTLSEKFDEFIETSKENAKSVDEMKSKCDSLQKTSQHLHNIFTDLKSRIELLETHKSYVESQVQNLGECLDNLEDQGSTNKGRIDHLQDQDKSKDERICYLEDQNMIIGKRIDSVQEQTEKRFDEVQERAGERIDRVQEQAKKHIDIVTKQTTEHIARVQEQTEVRIDRVQEQIDEMKVHVSKADVHAPISGEKEKEQQIKDLSKYLLEKYKRDESTVPMSPLLRRITASIDDVYIQLNIRDDLVHKPGRKQYASSNQEYSYKHQKRDVHSYRDVLYDGQNICRNIFVVGKAGIGKTTWSRKMVITWVHAMEEKDMYNENETVLQVYDLVFYLALRHAKGDNNILEMIEHQLFPDDPQLFSTVKDILNDCCDSTRCLIVLDGLDEWSSPRQCPPSDGLPVLDPRCKAVTITTTRAWKLETLQLGEEKIDRAVEIHGLVEDGTRILIGHIISAFNTHTGSNKQVCDFPSNIPLSVNKCLHVPLLLTIFVCLWYENDGIGQQLTEVYSGLMQLLLRYAEGNTRTQLFQKLEPNKLQNLKQKWSSEACLIPKTLTSKHVFVRYSPFLIRLGKLAFNALFSKNKESSLVFNYESVGDALCDDELDLAVNIGILSQTTCTRSVMEPEFTLSFLHKTIQEYMAALYMASSHQESKADCLDVYKSYCYNRYKVLETEMVLIFLSGLDPAMAGDISCYISKQNDALDMEIHQPIQTLLWRCLREEKFLSDITTHIYIKYHFLLLKHGPGKGLLSYDKRNQDTLSYLKNAVNMDTVLRIEKNKYDYRIHTEEDTRATGLDLSACKTISDLYVKHCSEQISLPTERLNKVVIDQYISGSESVLDMSGCKVLKSLEYNNSSVPVQLPTECLEKVVISDYDPETESVLDMSGCKVLKLLEYRHSSALVTLPTKCLEEVDIRDYNPRTESVLDMSACKVLKSLEYKSSCVPVQLPTECLQTLVIQDYNPSTESVLDMSGCKVLKSLEYDNSSVPVQLPTECLEELIIQNYQLRTEFVLDMSGCKVLKSLAYKWSSVPVLLPTECLEKLIILNFNSRVQTVLDMSGCKVLNTLLYMHSSIPVQLPSECLEKLDIHNYKTRIQTVLDMSGCKVLKSLKYRRSSVPVLLPTECLEKVFIQQYNPKTESMLDMSGCKVLKSLEYNNSSLPVQLPTECLENVVIRFHNSRTDSVLDMSGCKELKSFKYKSSSTPVKLPTESLKNVVIQNYDPEAESVLDMSGCKVLKSLKYERSSVRVQLPTECLEKVVIRHYNPKTESVLNMSGCKELKSLEYNNSSMPVQLPTDCLEKVVIEYYIPRTESVLDMSRCKVLKSLQYNNSCIPVQLPTECLEKLDIRNYNPKTESVLDMSGCQVLKAVIYKSSSVRVQLPTECLEKVVIRHYNPRTESVLDMCGCKVLKSLDYTNSSTPVQLPTECLQNVVIWDYNPRTESVLDMSGCKVLTSVEYKNTSVPVQLPTECLEEVIIQDYNPRTESVLDISECKKLKSLQYTNSSIPVQLPTECLEKVVIRNYSPRTESVLDMSGCKVLRYICYKTSTVPLSVPVSHKVSKVSSIDLESHGNLLACRPDITYGTCHVYTDDESKILSPI